MVNVAVVAGGDSGEFPISLKSGKQVELYMDRDLFSPYLIVFKGAKWSYHIGQKGFPVDKNDFSLTFGHRKVRFDIVFNAIHGTPGEDGRLQGYLEMIGIPYTSSDVTTSSLTMNKNLCKQVVASHGVKTARSVHVVKTTADPVTLIGSELVLPVFVKPNCGGSSVGMSKVNHKEGLNPALELAFQEDDGILVEEFIQGRELTCGVMKSEGSIIAFPVTEIISKKEYFDYEAKYRKGMSDEVVPAVVPESVSKKCQEISRFLYEKLVCKGVVRFDFIFNGNEFYFLEVNTVPGMTAASIIPKMARAHGWNFTELITRLIKEELKSQ